MIYLRYEFNDKEQAESKIAAQEDVNASFIKLDKFVLIEGLYDEDGVEITLCYHIEHVLILQNKIAIAHHLMVVLQLKINVMCRVSL